MIAYKHGDRVRFRQDAHGTAGIVYTIIHIFSIEGVRMIEMRSGRTSVFAFPDSLEIVEGE